MKVVRGKPACRLWLVARMGYVGSGGFLRNLRLLLLLLNLDRFAIFIRCCGVGARLRQELALLRVLLRLLALSERACTRTPISVALHARHHRLLRLSDRSDRALPSLLRVQLGTLQATSQIVLLVMVHLLRRIRDVDKVVLVLILFAEASWIFMDLVTPDEFLSAIF